MVNSKVKIGMKRTNEEPTVSPNQNKRKARVGTQHKWTTLETEGILNFMKDTILENREIEKPTANAYYESMLLALNFANVTLVKLKAKVANLKAQYLKAVDWRGKTGEGLLLTDPNGEQSVKDYLNKICQYYELLDEIYGTRASVNPPYIHASDQADHQEGLPQDIHLEPVDGEEITVLDPPDSPTPVSRAPYVERYKKQLIAEPKSWKNGIQKDSFSALTEVQAKRVEILNSKIQLDEKRFEAENRWKIEEFELESRKIESMDSHRHSELRLREMEIEKDERVKIMELEKDERVSKFKIEQEMKLQFDLAKLKQSH